ncbi:MAG TPA: PIG-L family deacetylase [Candidatus Dormibacteraeota bacterium]|nr:PIG-L family deacetylase [Candidatus Dormibacteraeota bacterium]
MGRISRKSNGVRVSDGAVVAVFHAHPDDEVFTTAAATLKLAAAGAQVRLFVATGGERAERGADPGLDDAAARDVREQRLNRSCELVGIGRWAYLSRPGRWIDTTDRERSLAAAPTAAVAAAVRAAIDDCRPQIVLSVGPDGVTGHPDHIAMHHAVAEALRQPGWRPDQALGAAVLDSDVRAAVALIERLTPRAALPTGSGGVTGVPASEIACSLHSPRAGHARKRAMDAYLDGLGTTPVEELISRYNLRGAALTLRALFDLVGWETDHFLELWPISAGTPGNLDTPGR